MTLHRRRNQRNGSITWLCASCTSATRIRVKVPPTTISRLLSYVCARKTVKMESLPKFSGALR